MNVKQFNIIPPKVLFDFALKASVRGFNENKSCMVESSERLDSLYLKIRFLGKPQTGRCNKSKQKRKKARGEIFFFVLTVVRALLPLAAPLGHILPYKEPLY